MLALVPIRRTPARRYCNAVSRSRTPPLAFTRADLPTTVSIISIAYGVAPPVLNPVEVFTKCAPAATERIAASIISSLDNKQTSKMTLTVTLDGQASTIAFISS